MKIGLLPQSTQHSPGRWTLAPVEPILHPSPSRLRLVGAALFLGQPLFGWIWSAWLPQPYENLWLRGLLGALGLVLTLNPLVHNLSCRLTQRAVIAILWLELPLFFSWMYFRNGGGDVWLASLGAIILVYYHLTDWRIATVGTASGALLACLLFRELAPAGPLILTAPHTTDAVIIAFCWGTALLLGVSSASLRREQLARTLATMGIMAHALRTPLSTAALIADAVQMESQRQPGHPRAAQLEKLGQRLRTLVRNMNQQIDTQMANVKLLQLLQLPPYSENISARDLVQDVVTSFPYAASRQRDCVTVIIHDDFEFLSSRAQFSQVLGNLIKNALHSLMAADSRYPAGALRIEVGRNQALGRIVVTDEGMGISPAVLPLIFSPFFSNNRDTGHGLGLAFCQRVVQGTGGKIQVKSDFAAGATFAITLPLASRAWPQPVTRPLDETARHDF